MSTLLAAISPTGEMKQVCISESCLDFHFIADSWKVAARCQWWSRRRALQQMLAQMGGVPRRDLHVHSSFCHRLRGRNTGRPGRGRDERVEENLQDYECETSVTQVQFSPVLSNFCRTANRTSGSVRTWAEPRTELAVRFWTRFLFNKSFKII